MAFWPQIPVEAKQTNCWQFIVIWCGFWYTVAIISLIAQKFPIGVIILYLVEIVIVFIILWHTAYTKVSLSEHMIEITMGPWEWPILRWCFSSQIMKEEIYMIENKRRECFYDVFPRLYCYPIMWCCCHKSYSSYFWPFCCDTVNVCNLCEGDSDTSNILLIYLSEDPMEFMSLCLKRCAPCPLSIAWCWCCVYNRVAVSINIHHNLVLECENLGYPLRIHPNVTSVSMASNDVISQKMGMTMGGNVQTNGNYNYSQMTDGPSGSGNGFVQTSAQIVTNQSGAAMGAMGNGVATAPTDVDAYGEYNAPMRETNDIDDQAEDSYRPPV